MTARARRRIFANANVDLPSKLEGLVGLRYQPEKPQRITNFFEGCLGFMPCRCGTFLQNTQDVSAIACQRLSARPDRGQ